MMVFSVKETATRKEITCSSDIYESFRCLGEGDQETFWVLGLNTKHREIYRKCLFVGGMAQSVVDVKIVFNRLLIHKAESWACIHNHPTGDPYPSQADVDLTRTLRRGSEILGLSMLDHVIIGSEGFYSFSDNGWNANKKWMGYHAKPSPKKTKTGKAKDLKINELPRIYLSLKKEYSGSLVFFECIEFFESYFEDAKIVSQFFDIPLSRLDTGRQTPINVCRIPRDFIHRHIKRLCQHGFSVAVVNRDPLGATM